MFNNLSLTHAEEEDITRLLQGELLLFIFLFELPIFSFGLN